MQDTSCRAGERFPPPANPCTPATPSGLEASRLAAKLQLSESPGGRGRGVRSRHPRPSREPQTRSARGLPAGWGLLRPSARSCPSAVPPAPPARPGAEETRLPRRRRGGGRERGEGAPTHPGRRRRRRRRLGSQPPACRARSPGLRPQARPRPRPT